MKKVRFSALFLVLTLLAAVTLSSCQKKAPVSPDQVAEAVFQLTFRQDASQVCDLFGYRSEDQARKDWLGEEEDFLTSVSEGMVDQFESMGLQMGSEEVDALVDATMTMLSKVEFSAEVGEMDGKAKTATVIGHVGYYDSSALNAQSEELLNSLLSNINEDALFTEDGMMEFLRAFFDGYAQLISSMEPAEGTKDIEVPFELVDAEINGKTQSVWMPVDAEQFGFDLSTTALGA